MTNITAKDIQGLRASTGAGMMDCKAALKESNGDMEEAVTWLRKKGLSKAAKKSDRSASEGLVALATSKDYSKSAVIECNCETDFVSRNELFQDLSKNISQLALTIDGGLTEVQNAEYENTGKSVNEYIAEMVGKIGENMQLRRHHSLSAKNGIVAGYIHNSVTDFAGRLVVIISLESDTDQKDKLYEFGKKLAMHIAATAPMSIGRDDMDATLVKKEKQLFIDQLENSGKPAEIVEKMVEGRLRKFFEESTLMEQVFVMDGKAKVSEAVEAMGKELGSEIKISAFHRMALGEGVEKADEGSLADEVKALTGN